MRNLIYFSISVLIFLIAGTDAVSQTVIRGKVLSADGKPIVKAEISTVIPGVQDIFADNRIRVDVAEDGAYQLHVDRPGIYNLAVRGVFHHTMNIPVLIYDQSTLEMNILMLPRYFNNGRHFENEDYLQWIRVLGNFNNFDFRTGEQFTLNSDGSISAMVPVTSDTMRIQVRGLNYGQGASAMPPADRYELRPDNSFVSVLYRNLPSDSLEIRYKPNETIPYRGVLPSDRNPNSLVIRGFLTFENDLERHWVEPITAMQAIPFRYKVLDNRFSEGITKEDQMTLQDREVRSFFDMDWNNSLEKISNALNISLLHEQQVNLLLLAYAGVVHRAAISRDHFKRVERDENIPKIEYKPVIIDRIFDEIEPGHTVWARNRLLPQFLLELQQFDDRRINYFTDLVLYHNNDALAANVSQAIVEATAQNYQSVEQLPVYQAILQRFGEGSVLRRAELVFEQQNRRE